MDQSLRGIVHLLAAITLFGEAGAQSLCPRSNLPAYAHNDYENPRPLADALRLGFSGVEADVFLVDGILRVGHDRRQARSAATMESLYLKPLRELVARCGRITLENRPFFVAIELKERSHATFDALAALLARFHELFTPMPTSSSSAPVEIVLVGWHPPLSTLRQNGIASFRLQYGISEPTGVVFPELEVRLLSVDYGKTVGRRWTGSSNRSRWLASLRTVKSANPERLLRVHNVPTDSTIYAALLDAGVDLIGTKDLEKTRRLLQGREIQ